MKIYVNGNELKGDEAKKAEKKFKASLEKSLKPLKLIAEDKRKQKNKK